MGFKVLVETNTALFVEDIGPSDGETILFIHGWPLNHLCFEYQYNQLPKLGYRCIGVDLRGFGQSDKPWFGYTYDQLSDDIRVIIDKLGLKSVTLAGHSMGGAISIRYMARHAGHQIARLALISAAAPSFTRGPSFPYGMSKREVDALIQETYTDRPALLSQFADLFFERPTSEPFKQWFIDLGLAAAGYATAYTAVSLRDEMLWNDLSSIHVPVGIFHGKKDKVCPYEFGEILHALILGSTLYPYEGAGHGVFYCDQDVFNQDFSTFIQTT
ncbi:alpha/beta fold hydrolase [Alkalicoccobacillus porphyridii]|uniref:Alpha/beta hydrolase n=1 Tax=Alkalicoccobacillus porphyridii TaxID=2597270 RepID=A0A554A0K6_9BACI|nr:alpha/beta hydrolase [Alkalicoccobacillus porphyridii]TSB47230.1 alpha/beta hydrolase [Alkalicoccobacillus porphyridii]